MKNQKSENNFTSISRKKYHKKVAKLNKLHFNFTNKLLSGYLTFPIFYIALLFDEKNLTFKNMAYQFDGNSLCAKKLLKCVKI